VQQGKQHLFNATESERAPDGGHFARGLVRLQVHRALHPLQSIYKVFFTGSIASNNPFDIALQRSSSVASLHFKFTTAIKKITVSTQTAMSSWALSHRCHRGRLLPGLQGAQLRSTMT
jgi:hypothetical protein